jgi:microcin C transport system substrate-binding protein
MFTRRSVLQSSTLALATLTWIRGGGVAPAQAETDDWRHGLSLFDDPKYPPDFKQFDYVNPTAPKGGLVREVAVGTFDNFNIVVAGVKGSIADEIRLTYDTLLARSLDEPSSSYGLLAESVAHSPDFTWAKFRLRTNARWHDGKPVTPEDVIFSFEVLKTNSPMYSVYYGHVLKAEKTGDREVTFTFDGPGNRELPTIVGELPVLPKHWWEGTDASGKRRDVTATTLEPPLGSGAYRLKEFVPGRSTAFERVKDYWGKDLNVRIGQFNFDERRFDYYRDLTVAFEAFKSGQFDWQLEGSAKNWATGYDFPAVADKRVLKEEFPIRDSGMMLAFAFNTRRPKFRDALVRRAFNFALDFENMNKQFFFGQYQRISSYFQGTEFACSGLPQGQELEILKAVRDRILETVRDKVPPEGLPPEVFTTAYTNPVGGNEQAVRSNLRQAVQLLKQARYEVRDTRLFNANTGERYTAELLLPDASYEKFGLFYQPSLARLGIELTIRTVDDVQYQNRLRNWDFDITIYSWGESLSPGNEQREFWGSQSADVVGSQNVIGINNQAIDQLIDRVIFAKSRAELLAATRALDRVLLWNHYVVPQWNYANERTARWDRFGRPDTLPEYGRSGFPTVWWWDAARAARVGLRS